MRSETTKPAGMKPARFCDSEDLRIILEHLAALYDDEGFDIERSAPPHVVEAYKRLRDALQKDS